MKKLLVFMMLLGMGLQGYSQDVKMPVTTASKTALGSYNESLKWFDRVDMNRGREVLARALEEDPDFFLANYQMALYRSWNGDIEGFMEYAGRAVNCKARLSQGEELLRSAARSLMSDPSSDVTDNGRKLVEMYPRDINAYNHLIYFQSFIGDVEGQLETITRALKVDAKMPSLYNQLGYAYLQLKQNDKAEAAFDRYIELDPKNPNVYDSKGDFYVSIKEYKKAYESYMKAYMIDNSWSYEKAQKAKQLYEMSEGKRLEIITM